MAKDGRPRSLPPGNGTEIEMDLPEYGYPKVVIASPADAQDMVVILRRNGVRVNLRGVRLEERGTEGVQKA